MPITKQRKSPAKLFRYLSAKWPQAFDPGAPRPLKIGIHDDIRARDDELSDEELRRALRAYTRMDQYLTALRAGVARVDLDGNPSGEVSDADAATATALLRTRRARPEARQAPEPTREPEPLARPEPKQMLTFKAKRTADRPADVVVVTKRRRSFRKPAA